MDVGGGAKFLKYVCLIMNMVLENLLSLVDLGQVGHVMRITESDPAESFVPNQDEMEREGEEDHSLGGATS